MHSWEGKQQLMPFRKKLNLIKCSAGLVRFSQWPKDSKTSHQLQSRVIQSNTYLILKADLKMHRGTCVWWWGALLCAGVGLPALGFRTLGEVPNSSYNNIWWELNFWGGCKTASVLSREKRQSVWYKMLVRTSPLSLSWVFIQCFSLCAFRIPLKLFELPA